MHGLHHGLQDGLGHKLSAGTRVSVLTRFTDAMLASSLVPVQHASLAPPACTMTASTPVVVWVPHTHSPQRGLCFFSR